MYRLFRTTLCQTSVARGLCQSHLNFAEQQLRASESPGLALELADGASTSGRGITTWASRCAALRSAEAFLPRATLADGLQPFTAMALRTGDCLAETSSIWSSLRGQVRWCQKGQLSRQRVPKSAGINDNIMPNTTQLKYGLYGIRALAGKRVAANTIEAVRRTMMRKIKKTARLWVRIAATVPVTKKPIGLRMGKGKGAISFYATPVRPGQIIFEMDRLPRTVALQALQAAQAKFPVKLGFVEWS